MFAKLIGKIKPVGRQDVGSLDMFLLSDSDEDDMANDSDFFGSLKKQHLKRKKIAEKYNKSNDKKIVKHPKSISPISTKKLSKNRKRRHRRMNKIKLRLDPIETANSVKHHLPIDWDPPYEDDLINKKNAVELEKFNEKVSNDFRQLHDTQIRKQHNISLVGSIMEDVIDTVEDINEQNEYVEPVDTDELLNLYSDFKLDFEYLSQNNKVKDKRGKKTKREIKLLKKNLEKYKRVHFVKSMLFNNLPTTKHIFLKNYYSNINNNNNKDNNESKAKYKQSLDQAVIANEISLDSDYVEALVKNRAIFKGVKEINMRNCGLIDVYLGDIIKRCVNKWSINKIDISDNRFGFRSAYYLMFMLNRKKCRVEYLNLSNVRLNDNVATILLSSISTLIEKDGYFQTISLDKYPRTIQKFLRTKYVKKKKKKVLTKEEKAQINLKHALSKLDQLALKHRGNIDLHDFRGQHVDASRLKKFLYKLGCKLTRDESVALTAHLDIDKNGTIQYKEFVSVFFSRWRILKKDGKIVDKFDMDQDDDDDNEKDKELVRYSGDSLLYLNLSYNKLGTSQKCCKMLGNLFSPNLRILHLNLSWNNFDAKAVPILSKCLSAGGNTSLKVLDLSWNSLGESAAILLSALITNTTLNVLNLEHNQIPSRACKSISKSLKQNDTLKTLRLDNNPIHESDAMNMILQSFKPNTSFIRKLGLEGIVSKLKVEYSTYWVDIWKSAEPISYYNLDLRIKREVFIALDILEALKYSNETYFLNQGDGSAAALTARLENTTISISGRQLDKKTTVAYIEGKKKLPTHGYIEFQLQPCMFNGQVQTNQAKFKSQRSVYFEQCKAIFSKDKMPLANITFDALKDEIQNPEHRVSVRYFKKTIKRPAPAHKKPTADELDFLSSTRSRRNRKIKKKPVEKKIEEEIIDPNKAMLSQSKLKLIASICKNYQISENQGHDILSLILNNAEVKRTRGIYEVNNCKCAALVSILLSLDNQNTTDDHNKSLIPSFIDKYSRDVDVELVLDEINKYHGIFPNNPTGQYVLSLENHFDRKALNMLISSFKDTNISFKERLFRNATVEGVDYTGKLNNESFFVNSLPQRGTMIFDLIAIPYHDNTYNEEVNDVPEKTIVDLDTMDKMLQAMNVNELNGFIKENDNTIHYHKMEKRVSKDKPLDLHEKNNLLDHNCTLNRDKLNAFRSTVEILEEICEHNHPMNEACFPSCKLHPFNRRYPGTYPSIKLNSIDNISGAMIDKFTELAIISITNLRAYLSTNAAWITSKVLETLFENSKSAHDKWLEKNGFHIYTQLLFATFSRTVDFWNVFPICKKWMNEIEYNAVVNFFGNHIVNEMMENIRMVMIEVEKEDDGVDIEERGEED